MSQSIVGKIRGLFTRSKRDSYWDDAERIKAQISRYDLREQPSRVNYPAMNGSSLLPQSTYDIDRRGYKTKTVYIPIQVVEIQVDDVVVADPDESCESPGSGRGSVTISAQASSLPRGGRPNALAPLSESRPASFEEGDDSAYWSEEQNKLEALQVADVRDDTTTSGDDESISAYHPGPIVEDTLLNERVHYWMNSQTKCEIESWTNSETDYKPKWVPHAKSKPCMGDWDDILSRGIDDEHPQRIAYSKRPQSHTVLPGRNPLASSSSAFSSFMWPWNSP
ncbi:hypothetical protein AB5N19_07235 [Seiridium cardinale]|uniref:Uncharacterized protein n=1 Tax=Seiridium cardinale TaxID=138064 RepID=A0ABR2Y3Z0_9PEZI